MANVTKLEDRGSNWSISYDDGGYDTVPKDPNAIDTAAAYADSTGQKELAAKFRMWAQNIRTKGVPVIVPMSTEKGILLVGVMVVGAFILFRRML
jgi:hypothetical protein